MWPFVLALYFVAVPCQCFDHLSRFFSSAFMLQSVFMKALVIANWKMTPATYREAKALFDATKKAAESAKKVQVIVAPPAIYLRDLAKGYRGKISFCLQNGFQDTHEPHTGEISFAQALDSKAEYVLVGHAERRAAGETNAHVRAKMAGALKAGLTPVLCIGEVTRSALGEHFVFVKEQLRAGLADVTPPALKRIIIAYEPVWAIGAPAPMTPRDMHEMAIFIRKSVVELFGEAGMEIKMLYGGSVDETTAGAMLRDGDVKGLLIGRASTEAHHVTNLLQAVEMA